MNKLFSSSSLKRLVSPLVLLVSVGLFCITIFVFCANTLINQPWLGIQWQLDPSLQGLRVASIAKGSPADSIIPPNTVLIQLQVKDQAPIALSYKLFAPAFSHATHADYNHYLKEQERLYQWLISGENLQFSDNLGNIYNLHAVLGRPFQTLPLSFFILSALFLVTPFLGVLVYIYRPTMLAAKLLFLASLNFYTFFLVDTVLFSKELALSAKVNGLLADITIFALSMYIAFFTTLFAIYPNALVQRRYLIIFFVFMLLYPLNFYFQAVDLWGHNSAFHSMPTYLLAICLSQYQIYKSKQNPTHRSAARLLQISIIVPFLPSMLFYILPMLLHQPPLLSDVSYGFSCLVFIGLAIAILKFRLFDMEYWWFKSWVWLLGGVLLVLIDFLLIVWLGVEGTYALSLSVLITSFVYFPLRQWLLSKVIPIDQQTIQSFLPVFSRLITSATDQAEFEQRWEAILTNYFQPLNASTQMGELHQARLVDNGLYLDIPSLSGNNYLRLTGKQLGMRLFTQANTRTADSLLRLARMTSLASEQRQHAITQERTRIMHDLHDTVGAKLLTLSHSLALPEHQQVARDTLQNLRQLISLSLQTTPITLSAYLADWRAETSEHLENMGISLQWQVDADTLNSSLTPRQVLEINDFIRNNLAKLSDQTFVSELSLHFFTDNEKRLAIQLLSKPSYLSELYTTPVH